MPAPKNPVQMAVIGAPHGVKGEVRVKAFTDNPLGLGDYGPLCDTAGRKFTVAEVRPAKTVVVVRFKEVTTREQAEALNGTALFVDRSALPADLEKEEFYHTDLVGLRVENETGATTGTVTAVHDFGGGDILEIRLSGRGTAMIPFTRAAVPLVNISEGLLRIDSVAAGLVEGEEGRAEPAGADDPVSRPRSTKKVRSDQ